MLASPALRWAGHQPQAGLITADNRAIACHCCAPAARISLPSRLLGAGRGLPAANGSNRPHLHSARRLTRHTTRWGLAATAACAGSDSGPVLGADGLPQAHPRTSRAREGLASRNGLGDGRNGHHCCCLCVGGQGTRGRVRQWSTAGQHNLLHPKPARVTGMSPDSSEQLGPSNICLRDCQCASKAGASGRTELAGCPSLPPVGAFYGFLRALCTVSTQPPIPACDHKRSGD